MPSAKLLIEIDGAYHQRRRAADSRRERKLGRLGYRVLRLDAWAYRLTTRDAITRVMCDLALDFAAFGREWDIDFADYFAVSLADLRQFSPLIDDDVFAVLTVEGSLAARNHHGATAPEQVRAAIARARSPT